jgi:hypothetical protein
MKTIQQILFERALFEESIQIKNLYINHGIPYCVNNEKKYNLTFPKSFLTDLKTLNYEKEYNYVFIGTISGNHRNFLKTWDRPKSLIKTTSQNNFVHPNNDPKKYYPDNFFNREYFQTLAKSKFTLTPGGCTAFDERHLKENVFLWTYRFWEACLSKSIPVTNEPDLNWYKDYKFYSLNDEHVYREDWVEHNYNLVKERHFIWIKD